MGVGEVWKPGHCGFFSTCCQVAGVKVMSTFSCKSRPKGEWSKKSFHFSLFKIAFIFMIKRERKM